MILERVRFPGNGQGPAGAPHLLTLLLRIATSASRGGVCLLLPETRGLDALLAVAGALQFLSEDAARATAELRAKLAEGTRVRVLPDGFVYRIGREYSLGDRRGVFIECPDGKLGKANTRFWLPEEKLVRFEPTERLRPASRPQEEWSHPRRALFDQLSGTETMGNHAVLRNRVLLAGSRSEFEAFLALTRLLPADLPGLEVPPLLDEFPWGSVTQDGDVYIEQPRSSQGEPLVAVSRSLVALRRASDAAAPGTRLMVSRWVQGFLADPDNAARLAERHRTILLVPGRLRDEIGPLVDSGWAAWELSPGDILGSVPSPATGLPCLDINRRCAGRKGDGSPEYVKVACELLDTVHGHLDAAGALLTASAEEDGEVDETLSAVWRLFLDASGWARGPDGTERAAFGTSMQALDLPLAMMGMFASREISEHARSALDGLKAFLDAHPPGVPTPKGAALVDAIRAAAGPPVVTGSRRSHEHLKAFLDDEGTGVECLPAASLEPGDERAHIIACSLVDRQSFSRLVDPWPAPRVTFVAYTFEAGIYRKRLARRSREREALLPGPDVRSSISGLPPECFSARPQPAARAEPPAPSGTDLLVERRWKPRAHYPSPSDAAGDATREGRLFRFSGCSWAVFTPGHGLSVLSSSGDDGNRIGRIGADDLQPGDRLLIREAGDKDVIRLVAEDEVGAGNYGSLWNAAQLWREALRSISRSPATLRDRLTAHGLRRDIMTIRYWLSGDDVIGPRSDDDVALIAEIAGHDPDAREWKKCREAIHQVRSLHMRSGMRLTRLLQEELGSVALDDSEFELPVDLSLGLLWIVQVTDAEPEVAHWPSGVVNRLHWGREGWREQLLRENGVMVS